VRGLLLRGERHGDDRRRRRPETIAPPLASAGPGKTSFRPARSARAEPPRESGGRWSRAPCARTRRGREVHTSARRGASDPRAGRCAEPPPLGAKR
jgi:hypothetical protein